VAVEAVPRQPLALVEPGLQLLRRRDEFEHVPVLDVAEQVYRGSTKWIARIEVARVFECECETAGLRVDAQSRRLTNPIRERDVEHLDVDSAHVAWRGALTGVCLLIGGPPSPQAEDLDLGKPLRLARESRAGCKQASRRTSASRT